MYPSLKNKNPGRKLEILQFKENEENIEESRKATNRFFSPPTSLAERSKMHFDRFSSDRTFLTLVLAPSLVDGVINKNKFPVDSLIPFNDRAIISKNFIKTTFVQKQAKNNLVTEPNHSKTDHRITSSW